MRHAIDFPLDAIILCAIYPYGSLTIRNEERTMDYTNTASDIPKENSATLADTVFKVAWLAILLGITMEVIMLVLAAYKSKFPTIEMILADLCRRFPGLD